MKLKKIISVFLALGIVAGATPAFAADSDLFHVGTPYDITKGEYTDELTAGNVIAVPVDITSTTDAVTNFQLELQYDNTVVTPCYDTSVADDNFWTNLDTLSGAQNYDADEVTLRFINALGTKRGSSFNGVGSLVFNPAVDDHTISYVWAYEYSKKLNVTTPECYFIFTVKNSVSSLNAEVFKAVEGSCLLADTSGGKDEVTNVANEADKVNACFGAFKVVVDDAELAAANKWVSALTANVYTDDTKATPLAEGVALQVYTNDGTTTYEFPTRITANAANVNSAYVEIVATLSDEAGTANNGTEVIATKIISMDSTVTDYE